MLHVLVGLLNNDKGLVLKLLSDLDNSQVSADKSDLGFPPLQLIGVPPVPDRITNSRQNAIRRRQIGNTAVTVAASLPASSRGSSHVDGSIPPVVARRVISLFSSLCKSSPRVAYSMLSNKAEDNEEDCTSNDPSCLEKLLDLLETRTYSESPSNLEQLLSLIGTLFVVCFVYRFCDYTLCKCVQRMNMVINDSHFNLTSSYRDRGCPNEPLAKR